MSEHKPLSFYEKARTCSALSVQWEHNCVFSLLRADEESGAIINADCETVRLKAVHNDLACNMSVSSLVS